MALEGTFHDTSLLDLFEIFQMGNKTGVLRLVGPSQHGTIHVTMGRLIDASVYDATTGVLAVAGDEAVLHMLQWPMAEFAFTHDSSTVRHPVTIFLTIDQLVRLSAQPAPPQAAPPLHMAMPIAANLAFIADLDPAAYTVDRQISRYYRRLSTFTTTYATNMPAQPFPKPESELNARSLTTVAQCEAPVKLAALALGNNAAERVRATAPTPQSAQPPRAAGSAGRRLLAAVLRRVREI